MSAFPAENIAAMEPLLPSDPSGRLKELSIELVRNSATLSSIVHPATRKTIVQLVRAMNSYYSNLIEGHSTHPLDIERALKEDFSIDPKKKALQLESKAHIEVQILIEQKLEQQPETAVCNVGFLKWIHKEFYERLPEEFRRVIHDGGKEDWIHPGELRQYDVHVGRHVAPSYKVLDQFLTRFENVYDSRQADPLERILTIAASHQRLAWIHPFVDGNGRVTRLFTHACLTKTQTHGHGLWTISRGLSRFRAKYMDALAAADQPRYNDLDGRGALSDKALSEFCEFFFDACLDQINFMSGLLNLDSMQERLQNFGRRLVDTENMPEQVVHVLSDTFLRGEISRAEVARIFGKSERTARRFLSRLLEEGLLVSDSHKGPVRLGLPMKVVGYYFPQLFPPGTEFPHN